MLSRNRYLHVSKSHIRTIGRCQAAVPWVIAGTMGCLCALLVALVSVRFSADVTKAWLLTTILGLLWKMLIFDPLKALCCGTLIDPLYAFITCDLQADALLEVAEEMVETNTENFTGQMGARVTIRLGPFTVRV